MGEFVTEAVAYITTAYHHGHDETAGGGGIFITVRPTGVTCKLVGLQGQIHGNQLPLC